MKEGDDMNLGYDVNKGLTERRRCHETRSQDVVKIAVVCRNTWGSVTQED